VPWRTRNPSCGKCAAAISTICRKVNEGYRFGVQSAALSLGVAARNPAPALQAIDDGHGWHPRHRARPGNCQIKPELLRLSFLSIS